MGPTILFDKSFLQSLSLNESVFFDHFFIPVICPVFYVETLADLEKAVRRGRSPEQEVGIIARKVPEMSGAPCAYHSTLAIGNLFGLSVPMTGQIPVAGGKPVKVDGQTAVIHGVSPTAEAFARWQREEFLDVERSFAQGWRAALNGIDLTTLAAAMRAMGTTPQTCKSLTQVDEMVKAFLSRADNIPNQVKLSLVALGALLPEVERWVLSVWRSQGLPALSRFAPYAAHVVGVELFFQLALGADLIGTSSVSNRTDIAYLFYAPFCQIFVFSDKLHKRCAPHFLRTDQSFVWGPDLKQDLGRLEERYKKLPEEQKEQGLMRCAPTPPRDDRNCLVTQLWDRHFALSWRKRTELPPEPDHSQDAKLIEHLNRFSKAPRLSPVEVDFDPVQAGVVQISRRIYKRKGSWWQLPKDLKDSGS